MEMPRSIFCSALALSFLAGCTQENEPPGAGAAPTTTQQVAGGTGAPRTAAAPGPIPCPPATTTIVRSNGVTVDYLGPDHSDPNLCRYTVNGQEVKGLFSVWPVDPVETPGEIADLRAALAKVLAGPMGTTATVHQKRAVNGYFLQKPGFETKMGWRLTFLNAGTEPMDVAGVSRQTVKLRMTQQSEFRNIYSATYDYWLDLKRGAQLRFDYHLVNGVPANVKPWVALSITQ